MSAGRSERRVEAPYKGLCGLERRYLATILGGAVMGIAALVGLYIGMGFTQYMPPPSLANTLCIDEKLEFLRERPQINPNVLTVGSSIAWRNIDSAVLAENLPDAQPLNGAFCAMRVHQSLAVGEWFIQRWPSIDEMLLVVGSQDFVDCRDSAEVFDFESARDYTFAGKPSWRFYLRYADPVSFIRNAIERAKRPDDPLTESRSIALTQYGDGPVNSGPLQKGVHYDLGFGRIANLDSLCFKILRSVATRVTSKGLKMMVVVSPIHPDWKALYDSSGSTRSGFERRLVEALAGTDVLYWNADRAGVLNKGDAFIDAVHLRWPMAKVLTGHVVHKLRGERDAAGCLKEAQVACPSMRHLRGGRE